MVYCSRCSRRREYHWTILLAVILVFLYTYLYSVHVGSQDSRKEELYGTDRRLPGAREVNDNVKVDKLPIVNDKTPGVVYKEPQLVKDVNEIKSQQADNDDSKTNKPQPVDKGNEIVDKPHDDRVTDKVDDRVTSDERQDNNGIVDDELKITDPIIRMREQVNKINENEVIINDDKFTTFDLVMIIQVHRRTEYLKMLLESLRNARDISKVLLVVSFDYYDEELFSVVEKVDFCKVMTYYTSPAHHLWR